MKDNLIGRRFTCLSVIADVSKKRELTQWLCRCDCGQETVVASHRLLSGNTRSCGCLKKRRTREANTNDLTGHRYGRLVVLKQAPNKKHGVAWHCLCECGNGIIVYAAALRKGNTKSCGCFSRDVHEKSNTTHGCSRRNKYTKEYWAWAHMKDRCANSKNERWPHYGGRGIKVCDRWVKDFGTFLKDMGNAPSPKHSVDRINVNGNYEPGNCRWANHLQQANNKQTTKKIIYEGHEYNSMAELCRALNLNYQTLGHFRRKYNLPISEAVSKTVMLHSR